MLRLCAVVLLLQLAVAFGAKCSVVDPKGWSTDDGTAQGAFAVSFGANCDGKPADFEHNHFFANVKGTVIPAAASEEGVYQVSWFQNESPSGQYNVDVYDSAESASNPDAKPQFTVTVDHETTITAGLPVSTEFIAFFVVSFVFYQMFQVAKNN